MDLGRTGPLAREHSHWLSGLSRPWVSGMVAAPASRAPVPRTASPMSNHYSRPVQHTIAIAQVTQILQGARAKGVDCERLLQRAGIAPTLVGSPLARVTRLRKPPSARACWV